MDSNNTRLTCTGDVGLLKLEEALHDEPLHDVDLSTVRALYDVLLSLLVLRLTSSPSSADVEEVFELVDPLRDLGDLALGVLVRRVDSASAPPCSTKFGELLGDIVPSKKGQLHVYQV